jgi:predicted small lipoprotein YifL
MIRARRPLFILLCALALAVSVAGCGNKGDLVRPKPPAAASG